jgi:hypothetical protein
MLLSRGESSNVGDDDMTKHRIPVSFFQGEEEGQLTGFLALPMGTGRAQEEQAV